MCVLFVRSLGIADGERCFNVLVRASMYPAAPLLCHQTTPALPATVDKQLLLWKLHTRGKDPFMPSTATGDAAVSIMRGMTGIWNAGKRVDWMLEQVSWYITTPR